MVVYAALVRVPYFVGFVRVHVSFLILCESTADQITMGSNQAASQQLDSPNGGEKDWVAQVLLESFSWSSKFWSFGH